MSKHHNHTPASLAQIGDYLAYDAETGVLTWKADPGYKKLTGKIAGRVNKRGYVELGFAGKRLQAHRVAWFLFHGEFTPIVDHRNGITSDNRISNLRAATLSENNMNSRKRTGRSLPKGVYLDAREGVFRAQIRALGKRYCLGRFKDPEDAAAAYRSAAVRYHGEFARFE